IRQRQSQRRQSSDSDEFPPRDSVAVRMTSKLKIEHLYLPSSQLLQKIPFIYADSRLSENGTKCSNDDLSVFRYDSCSSALIVGSRELHVRALLRYLRKACGQKLSTDLPVGKRLKRH